MGKKKAPTFSKMVCEALTAADDEKGMNAKMILNFMKEKYSITGDDKTNINLIHKELERGKTANEYLQVQGNSVHGHFTFNIFYQPPSETKTNELPAYLDPPEPSNLVVEALREPKKRRKKTKAEKDQDSSTTVKKDAPTGSSRYMVLRMAPNGIFEEGHLDKNGNMKFTESKDFAFMSRDLLAQRMKELEHEQVSPEDAAEFANDPLVRRVFSQIHKPGGFRPEIQKHFDKAPLQKTKNMLRCDKTDSIRLGIHSHAGEMPEDQNNEPSTSVSQDMCALKIEEEERKLDPEVEAILSDGVVKSHVESLKSADSEARIKALSYLNDTINQTEHHRIAVIESGAIPCLVECISNNNLDFSTQVIKLLKWLCIRTPDACKHLIEADIIKKLMELNSDSPEVLSFFNQFVAYSLQNKLIMEKDKLNDFVQFMLEVIEKLDEKTCACMIKGFTNILYNHRRVVPKHVTKLEISETKVQFLYSKFYNKDEDLNYFLLQLFHILIDVDGKRFVPILTNFGFVHKLSELMECDKLIMQVFGCLQYVVENCPDGYKYIHETDVLSKLLPFIQAENKAYQKAVTKIYGSLISANFELMTRHLTLKQLQKLIDHVYAYDLWNKKWDDTFYNLGMILKSQPQFGPRKALRKARKLYRR